MTAEATEKNRLFPSLSLSEQAHLIREIQQATHLDQVLGLLVKVGPQFLNENSEDYGFEQRERIIGWFKNMKAWVGEQYRESNSPDLENLFIQKDEWSTAAALARITTLFGIRDRVIELAMIQAGQMQLEVTYTADQRFIIHGTQAHISQKDPDKIDRNEDFSKAGDWLEVYDGMGGHGLAAECSRAAHDGMRMGLKGVVGTTLNEVEQQLETAFSSAHQEVRAVLYDPTLKKYNDGGTTAVVAKEMELLDENGEMARYLVIASVGDSPAYIYDPQTGLLEKKTIDDDQFAEVAEMSDKYRAQVQYSYRPDSLVYLLCEYVTKKKAELESVYGYPGWIIKAQQDAKYRILGRDQSLIEQELFRTRNQIVKQLGHDDENLARPMIQFIKLPDYPVAYFLASDGVTDIWRQEELQVCFQHYHALQDGPTPMQAADFGKYLFREMHRANKNMGNLNGKDDDKTFITSMPSKLLPIPEKDSTEEVMPALLPA